MSISGAFPQGVAENPLPVNKGGTGRASWPGYKVVLTDSNGNLTVPTTNSNSSILTQANLNSMPVWTDKLSMFYYTNITSSVAVGATTLTISNSQIKSNNFVWLSPYCDNDNVYKQMAGLNLYFKSQQNGSVTLGIANPNAGGSTIYVYWNMVVWG